MKREMVHDFYYSLSGLAHIGETRLSSSDSGNLRLLMPTLRARLSLHHIPYSLSLVCLGVADSAYWFQLLTTVYIPPPPPSSLTVRRAYVVASL